MRTAFTLEGRPALPPIPARWEDEYRRVVTALVGPDNWERYDNDAAFHYDVTLAARSLMSAD